MKEVQVCDHCGAKMVEYKFSLNTGLVRCLYKLKKAGGRAEVSELKMTNSEYCNFHMLAFWGLAKKVPGEDSEAKRRGGKWGITKLGGKFLRGEVSLNKFVWTYRGTPVRLDGDRIYIEDVKDGYKYKMDYVRERV